MMKKIITVDGVECYMKDGFIYIGLDSIIDKITAKDDTCKRIAINTLKIIIRKQHISTGKNCFFPENVITDEEFFSQIIVLQDENGIKFFSQLRYSIIPEARSIYRKMIEDDVAAEATIKNEARIKAERVRKMSEDKLKLEMAEKYIKAARLISKCPANKLNIVLQILEDGGICTDKIKGMIAEDTVKVKETVRWKKHNPLPSWVNTNDPSILELREAYMNGASIKKIALELGIDRANLYQIMSADKRRFPNDLREKLTEAVAAFKPKEQV